MTNLAVRWPEEGNSSLTLYWILMPSNTRAWQHAARAKLWICLAFWLLSAIREASALGPKRTRSRLHQLSKAALTSLASEDDTAFRHAPAQVPRIIHQVFLAGESEYNEQASTGRIKRQYRDSCRNQHPDWEHKFWAREEAETLVKADYAWFWEIWIQYKHWVCA